MAEFSGSTQAIPPTLFTFLRVFPLALFLLLPQTGWSAEPSSATRIDLTQHWVGYATIAIFAMAYALAVSEETTMLRKSKPMVFAASLIWVLIASIYAPRGLGDEAGRVFRSTLESYGELFLFILVSMTYLNAMEQRGIFDKLRLWLLSRGFGYRKLFWVTGIQSFFLSAVCSNLATALLMGAVVMAMANNNRRFTSIACVNIVVATNAGGSFSPFGDITTLLVWQKGVVPFTHFFSLFLPSIVTFVLPAAIMHFWVPKDYPASAGKPEPLRHGAMGIMTLFVLTIVTAVGFENFLGLPPAAGMMAGLGYLSFYFFYLYKVRVEWNQSPPVTQGIATKATPEIPKEPVETKQHFDVFHNIAQLEWDTLLYFYGVMVGVGGLSFIGYLTVASNFLYTDLNPTVANVLLGMISAFIDNGTIMYTVLTMAPSLSEGQWLLVTLTVGVGGSLLAIGSAAGVGLMGQSKGAYSFASHMKWTPVIALGYAGGVLTHLLVNRHLF
jgi:Na+/H+ antiporter NhaD/arsenite permease-like protein